MGDDVLFQPKTLPNEPELIKLHNNVRIAADVTFYTHDVINNLLLKTMDKEDYIPHRSCIEIFDNVFIGGHSVIVGDVSIGPNAIIAAGSVVTKDVPPYSIVGGVPAKVIGYRFSKEQINFLLKLKWWDKGEEWIENHVNYFSDIDKLIKIVNEENKIENKILTKK